MMQVIRYDKAGTKKIPAMVNDDFPFAFSEYYHSFMQSMGDETAMIADSNGALVPIRIMKKSIFRIAQIIYPPVKDGQRLEASDEKRFWEEMILHLKSEKLFHKLIQPMLLSNFNAFPENSISCKFGYYSLPLTNKTEEEIFSAFQKRYRGSVRFAERQGAEIRYGKSQLHPFYELYRDTMKREGSYCDGFDYIRLMYEHLGDEHLLTAVVYHDNVAQAGLLVPFTRFGASLLLGGAVPRPNLNGIVKYLHWEVFRKLKSFGAKQVFFGGARINNIEGTKWEGIQKFKERFGPEKREGYLWKADLNPTMAKLYTGLLNTKLRLTGNKIAKDAIDSELGL